MLICKVLLENGLFLQKFKNVAVIMVLLQFPNCFIVLHGKFQTSYKFLCLSIFKERENGKNFHF